MEVTLKPDNRKATVVEDISESHVKVQLEDGRIVPWPKSRINLPPKEGEETLKLMIVPAIDRLHEFYKDFSRLNKAKEIKEDVIKKVNEEMTEPELKLFTSLLDEAIIDYNHKWGLI